MKTTFDFKFDLYQALNSIATQIHRNKEDREAVNLKRFSFITCKLRKKVV